MTQELNNGNSESRHNHESNYNEFRIQAAAVLSEALEVSVSSSQNVLRTDLDSWDSLKHLELIMLIEEKFHLRLSVEQALSLESLDDIAGLIEGSS